MNTITIRGIDTALRKAIKKRAAEAKSSVNQWLLGSLKKIAGLNPNPVFREYHDLDHLAGGWSADEGKKFLENISVFSEIDGEFWK